MRRERGKSRFKRRRLLYRIVSVFSLFVLLGGAYEAIRLVQFHLEEKGLRDEIDRLKRENREMTETKRRLEEDPSEIERRAREDLGMMKEGERIYRLIEPRSRGEDGVEEGGG